MTETNEGTGNSVGGEESRDAAASAVKPNPPIPAPGTSETFPPYPDGSLPTGESGDDGEPANDMTVETTGSEGNTDTVPEDDQGGSLIDHPTDGTDSQDRHDPDRPRP